MMRLRYGENFAGSTQAIRYGETLRLGKARSVVPSGRARARLGADRVARERHAHRRVRRLQGRAPTRPARRSSSCRAMSSSPRRPSVCRCSATAIRRAEIDKLLRSVALFPERAHLVGAYSLGKAQRVIALIRAAGYDKPIYLHGAMEKHHALLRDARDRSRRVAAGARREEGRARRRHRALPAVVAAGSAGRGAFPIRCRRSRRAGCGCARGRASAASSCRW